MLLAPVEAIEAVFEGAVGDDIGEDGEYVDDRVNYYFGDATQERRLIVHVQNCHANLERESDENSREQKSDSSQVRLVHDEVFGFKRSDQVEVKQNGANER